MDVAEARTRLASSAHAFSALLADVAVDEERYRPQRDAWSILEIVGHLRLEEIEDFRTRFSSTVHDPAVPWPALDPEARVREEAFDERPLATLLAEFHEARRESLAYLGGLEHVDLGATYRHPRGAITSGDLLASWVAHDLLHVRQIVKNRYAYWQERVAPHRLGYAGPW